MSTKPKQSAIFSLELGPEVANIKCDHCGAPFKSVNGYIKKDDSPYSIYFASLQTGHNDTMVGLTVSIGRFWDDTAVDQRSWLYLRVWPSESGSGFEIRVEEPEASRHLNSKIIDKKLTCEQARKSPLLDGFFAVADYVIDNDPAVLSYLSGDEINIAGRVCRH